MVEVEQSLREFNEWWGKNQHRFPGVSERDARNIYMAGRMSLEKKFADLLFLADDLNKRVKAQADRNDG